jgi:hypothetical protein
MIIRISFKVEKDAIIELSIIFNDLTLETVLNGLRTLKVLRAFRFSFLLTVEIILDKTMMKSSWFHLSRK